MGLELLPVEWCLCCVPLCCGLRGGVMAIAILQISIGFLWLLASVSTSVTVVVQGASITQTGQSIGSLLFFLVAATTWLVIGVLGIIATHNRRKIATLDYNTLQTTVWYYRSNVAGFAVCTFLSVVGSMLTTLSAINGEFSAKDDTTVSRTTAEVATIITVIWLVTAIGVVVEVYFLYIIWSYKIKLDAFYYGRKCGAFVIKNTLPYAAMTIDQEEGR